MDGDRATGLWDLLVAVIRAGETQPLRIAARYYDRYVREHGSWRIAEMRLETLYRNL